ncbi:HAD-IIB family hydrolase [endosymbiont GvMRE of Glomus versiforme]|uniref:HAD-IIB family hydrolase n=1 Tax=endosymbiont GvMRE of Glomus versiforme TaxID=2039283 RepID=UPI000ED33218|nr:HAD-IIB family hydrolase [endosymbiont GvMRE of Glomus versiforme]RHZ37519.1 COF family hydrolase [endosymbiont GvMRE of Glomus versiforme]
MAEKATKKDIQITKKKLILIDLDGTTLDKDFRTFNELNHKVFTYLHQLGHKVCIVTGRNYLSALPYYEKLGLNTLMATYNGAYINNPKKEKLKKGTEIININHISNGIVRGIMQEKVVKENLLNSLVDNVDREIICTEDKDIYWHEVWFNMNKFTHTNDILKSLEKKNALQLILEFENEEKKLNEIIATLRKKYHVSVFFDVVNKLKKDPKNSKSPTLVPDPKRIVIRIRSAGANKGIAVNTLSHHYGIPMEDIIAFGDSENDIEMIRDTTDRGGWGVAMANAETYLKTLGRDITEKKNYEGGVGDYLIKYFNLSLNTEKKKK